jgi:hypothetical protein
LLLPVFYRLAGLTNLGSTVYVTLVGLVRPFAQDHGADSVQNVFLLLYSRHPNPVAWKLVPESANSIAALAVSGALSVFPHRHYSHRSPSPAVGPHIFHHVQRNMIFQSRFNLLLVPHIDVAQIIESIGEEQDSLTIRFGLLSVKCLLQEELARAVTNIALFFACDVHLCLRLTEMTTRPS